MLPPTTGWVTRKELFAGNFTNEPNNSGDILYSEESMNTFSKVEAAVGNSFIKSYLSDKVTQNLTDELGNSLKNLKITKFESISQKGNFLTLMKQNSGDATGQVGTIHNVNVNDLGHYLTIDTENNQPYNTWIEVPVDNGGGVYEYYYVNFKLLNDAFTAASGQPDGKFVQYMTNSTAIDGAQSGGSAIAGFDESTYILSLSNKNTLLSYVDKWFYIPELITTEEGPIRATNLRHSYVPNVATIPGKFQVLSSHVSAQQLGYDSNTIIGGIRQQADGKMTFAFQGVGPNMDQNGKQYSTFHFGETYEQPSNRYRIIDVETIVGFNANSYSTNVWVQQDDDTPANISLFNMYTLTERTAEDNQETENQAVQLLLTEYKYSKDRVIRELLISILAEIALGESTTIKRMNEHKDFATLQMEKLSNELNNAFVNYVKVKPNSQGGGNLAYIIKNSLFNETTTDPAVTANLPELTLDAIDLHTTAGKGYVLSAEKVFGLGVNGKLTGMFKQIYDKFVLHTDEVDNFYTVLHANLETLKREAKYRKESLPFTFLKSFRDTMEQLVSVTDTDFTTELDNFNTFAREKPYGTGTKNVNDTAEWENIKADAVVAETNDAGEGVSALAILNGDIANAALAFGINQQTAS